MAAVTCYECGGVVSTYASACPRCGAPVQERRVPTVVDDIKDWFSALSLPWVAFLLALVAPVLYGWPSESWIDSAVGLALYVGIGFAFFYTFGWVLREAWRHLLRIEPPG